MTNDYELFKHMSDEHGLTLTGSEMHEIRVAAGLVELERENARLAQLSELNLQRAMKAELAHETDCGQLAAEIEMLEIRHAATMLHNQSAVDENAAMREASKENARLRKALSGMASYAEGIALAFTDNIDWQPINEARAILSNAQHDQSTVNETQPKH